MDASTFGIFEMQPKSEGAAPAASADERACERGASSSAAATMDMPESNVGPQRAFRRISFGKEHGEAVPTVAVSGEATSSSQYTCSNDAEAPAAATGDAAGSGKPAGFRPRSKTMITASFTKRPTATSFSEDACLDSSRWSTPNAWTRRRKKRVSKDPTALDDSSSMTDADVDWLETMLPGLRNKRSDFTKSYAPLSRHATRACVSLRRTSLHVTQHVTPT